MGPGPNRDGAEVLQVIATTDETYRHPDGEWTVARYIRERTRLLEPNERRLA